jgi:hypothetical protein
VAVVCISVGIAVGLLACLAPAVWQPVGAGISVTSLLLALYGLWRGRHQP